MNSQLFSTLLKVLISLIFLSRFDINQLKSTKETNAINIRIIETQHPRDALIPTSAGTGHVLRLGFCEKNILSLFRETDTQTLKS